MRSSYYHDGEHLPGTLGVPVEQLPEKGAAAAHIAVNNVMEVLRSVGACPSPEFRDVYDFHRKFGLMAAVRPRHLTRHKLKERVEFLLEELQEFTEACGLDAEVMLDENGDRHTIINEVNDDQDLAQQADALVDLVYVALGTAVMLGLPWDVLWADVQRANITKERGVTHRGHAIDVRKPAGWVGPRTEEILAAAGYDRDRFVATNRAAAGGAVCEDLCADDATAVTAPSEEEEREHDDL